MKKANIIAFCGGNVCKHIFHVDGSSFFATSILCYVLQAVLIFWYANKANWNRVSRDIHVSFYEFEYNFFANTGLQFLHLVSYNYNYGFIV